MSLTQDRPRAYALARTLREKFGDQAVVKAKEMADYARANNRGDAAQDIDVAHKMLAAKVW